jgi:hypothetical protein
LVRGINLAESFGFGSDSKQLTAQPMYEIQNGCSFLSDAAGPDARSRASRTGGRS